MKASVELCNNKLSDAAAKSEPKAGCETFDSELWELTVERRMAWLTRVCQVSWRFGRTPKGWQTDHPCTQQWRRE